MWAVALVPFGVFVTNLAHDEPNGEEPVAS